MEKKGGGIENNYSNIAEISEKLNIFENDETVIFLEIATDVGKL